MSNPIFRYRNTLTGLVVDLTEDAASTMPEYLERVADDAKPYEPGLFKPGKVGEFSNPEPLTDAQLAAAQNLEAVAETNGPGTNVVKDARAAQKAADEKAAADAEAAQKAAAESGVGVDSAPEGGNQ